MKKVTILSLVLILLAVSVAPVMAAGGPSHNQGNGVSAGQGNNGGNQDRTKDQEHSRDQDQIKLHDQERTTNPGLGGNGNTQHMRMRTPFYLQGTITTIDSTAKTLQVTLIHGNAQVKQYLGSTLTLQATDSTLIFQITQNEEPQEGRVPIIFDQLAVGQKVAIHGNLVNSVYTARLITVYIQMLQSESAPETP